VQKGKEANCGLHPLIHTLLEFTLAQDMVSCRCGEKRTPIDLMWMESRQKNMGMSDILTPDEMNLLVFIYLQAIIDYQSEEVSGFIGNPFELDSDYIVRIVFFRG
jgi:hypothetical protein